MRTMKAAQVTTPHAPFDLVERPLPEPGPGQVRIKVAACGICHSDVLVKVAAWPGMKLPRIPGHEIAGHIDAVGAHVAPWREGDAVGVGWHGGHCFHCTNCRKGLYINCAHEKITGISHDGGYAEYVVVPAESLARIPQGLSPEEAAPLLCAGITTFNALRNSGARAGDTVAVLGIGGLGHLAVQYAAHMGFRTVAISRGSDKEPLARALGAHEYIDTQASHVATELNRLGGADLVLATAPNGQAISDTVNGLKARGKLLIVAAPREPLTLSAATLLSGKSIAGWPSGTAIDAEEAMAFSVLTGVRPQTELFPLERADEALSRVLSNQVRFRAVLTP